MSVYTDLSAEFDFKDLLTWQNMDLLAENDNYAAIPGGSAMCFYQAAAPAGWLKQTSIDDAMVRVVDGAGGGNGGTANFSTAFSSIAHTHTVAAHTHAVAAHVHRLAFTAAAAGHNASTTRLIAAAIDGSSIIMAEAGGASNARIIIDQTNASDGAGTTTSTAPTTNSSLTNLTFLYIDVIVCTKGS